MLWSNWNTWSNTACSEWCTFYLQRTIHHSSELSSVLHASSWRSVTLVNASEKDWYRWQVWHTRSWPARLKDCISCVVQCQPESTVVSALTCANALISEYAYTPSGCRTNIRRTDCMFECVPRISNVSVRRSRPQAIQWWICSSASPMCLDRENYTFS